MNVEPGGMPAKIGTGKSAKGKELFAEVRDVLGEEIVAANAKVKNVEPGGMSAKMGTGTSAKGKELVAEVRGVLEEEMVGQGSLGCARWEASQGHC